MNMSEDVLKAFDAVKGKVLWLTRAPNRKEWIILFDYYNSNQPEGQVPLSINCAPCFAKVLLFIKEKIAADEKLKSNEFRSQNIV